MPETENIKLYAGAKFDPPTEVAACEHPYAELDVTTNFSFLHGASHPDELVYTAALLGYRAMAVTDINTLAGVVRAFEAARKVKGFQLIVGARLVFTDGSPDLLVWPTDRDAYARLSRLLTLGRRRAPKGECHLTLVDFLDHSEGMLAAFELKDCLEHQTPPLRYSEGADFLAPRNRSGPSEYLRPGVCAVRENPGDHDEYFHRAFESLGDRLSLAIHLPHDDDDQARLDSAIKISRQTRIPLLATNHVHYHDPRQAAHCRMS